MPRKPKSTNSAQGSVPDHIQQSRTYQKKAVTKRKLPSFTEAMLLIHAPELLRKYFEALLCGLKDGDKTALEQVGEIFNFVKGKGINVNLTQQMMAQGVAAGEQAPVMGYDALVRQLAESRAGHALPAPIEVLDIRPADITVVDG